MCARGGERNPCGNRLSKSRPGYAGARGYRVMAKEKKKAWPFPVNPVDATPRGYVFKDSRDTELAQIALGLPDARDELFESARGIVDQIDAALVAGDLVLGDQCLERYDAVLWKLNGGATRGMCATDESPGALVERYCAAPPGQVPKWGQQGSFLVEVDGVRVWVEAGPGYGIHCPQSVSLHAVDLDRPFVSETGYRSTFPRPPGTLLDAVLRVIRHYLEEHRRYLGPEHQDSLASRELPDWLKAITPPLRRPRAVYEIDTSELVEIPPGYVMVDAIVTSYQAFTVKKWAHAAHTSIRKRKAKPAKR